MRAPVGYALRYGALACWLCVLGTGLAAQPTASVAEDTVFTCVGAAVTLVAEPGYGSYLWRELGGANLSGSQTYVARARRTQTFVVESRPRTGPNLAANATFDEGPAVGYETDYDLNESGAARAGTYNTVDDPRAFDERLAFCFDADRNPTEGKMMVTSTAPDRDRLLYRQRVPVEAGKTYLVSAWAVHVSTAPVRLDVLVNGRRFRGGLEVRSGPCDTDQFNADYVGDDAEVVIEVYNALDRGGAAFGLDGIVVAEQSPPRFDTVTVVAVGESLERITPGVCGGRVYTHVGGEEVAAGDSLVLRYANRGGCDSVVVVAPRDLSRPDTLATVGACARETVPGYDFAVERDTVVCASYATEAGCDSVVCVAVDVFDASDFEARTRDNACAGAPNGAIAIGGAAAHHRPLSVAWGNGGPAVGDTVRRGLSAGLYTARVASAQGCVVGYETDLGLAAALTVDLGAVVGVPGCRDAPPTISLGFGGGVGDVVAYEVSRDGGTVGGGRLVREGAPATVELDGAGPYSIALTDSLGCLASGTVELATAAGWSIAGPERVPLDSASTFRLSGATADAGAGVRWYPPGGGAPTVLAYGAPFVWSADAAGVLRAEVLDGGVCLGATALTIATFTPDFARFPTAFSPNGDGVNDGLELLEAPDRAQVASLSIYDRWGARVYAAGGCVDAPGACVWGGRTIAGDAALAPGVYVYVAELILPDGRTLREAGEVTLVR